MNATLEPFLASCPCGFSYACNSAEEKQRREATHRDRHHPSVDAVTSLLTADPSHDADVQTIVEAIEYDAAQHDGEVDQNRVRRLLPAHVQPTMVGAVYNQLVRQGRLERIGWTTNEDRRGRNVGKPLSLYRLWETT